MVDVPKSAVRRLSFLLSDLRSFGVTMTPEEIDSIREQAQELANLCTTLTGGESAIQIAVAHGATDGGHHKMWVIDQMVRILTGREYSALIPHDWDEGIAP